jgi:hypothetical protein
VFPENPIEEPKFSSPSEESVHLGEDNMYGIIFGDREDERGPRGGEEERQERQEETCTSTLHNEFGFPILYPTIVSQMRNIPPSTLPNFHV